MTDNFRCPLCGGPHFLALGHASETIRLYEAIDASLNDLGLGTDERVERARLRLARAIGDIRLVPREAAPTPAQTTYISDKMVLGARCLNCGADAMDHSCIEAAPTPATPDEWHFDPRCAWHDPGIAAKDLRPQECEHFPAAPPACGHGALIDGDNNCPDCGAPVIYR